MTINLEDRLAMYEAVIQMFGLVDSCDAEGFAKCFTQNAEFVSSFGEYTGRRELQEMLEEGIAEGKEDGSRHFVTNLVVNSEGEDPSVQFHVLKMKVDTGPTVLATEVGTAIGEKINGTFLFKRFRVEVDEVSIPH